MPWVKNKRKGKGERGKEGRKRGKRRGEERGKTIMENEESRKRQEMMMKRRW
jgi:hypothetical protein